MRFQTIAALAFWATVGSAASADEAAALTRCYTIVGQATSAPSTLSTFSSTVTQHCTTTTTITSTHTVTDNTGRTATHTHTTKTTTTVPYTVGTVSGWAPVQSSLPGSYWSGHTPTKKKRNLDSLKVHRQRSLRLKSRGAPQKVDCYEFVRAPTCTGKTITTTVTATTRATATTRYHTSVFVTTTETVTVTNTASTVYAACATNNFVDGYYESSGGGSGASFQVFGTRAANNGAGYATVADIDSIVGCCDAAQLFQQSPITWGFSADSVGTPTTCYLWYNQNAESCDPRMNVGLALISSGSGVSDVMGTARCGYTNRTGF